MDDDVLDILEVLGYKGALVDKEKLLSAVNGGAKSIEYTQLVEWLSKDLRQLCGLEDNVNAITKIEDSSSFLLEVSSFLKELNCPHQILTSGNVNQRLQTVESRLLLLVYLGTELQASRINSLNESSSAKAMEVGVKESPTAHDLKSMLIALNVSKPPDNITAALLFSKIDAKVKERLSKFPVKKPLFFGLLSPQQWQALDKLHKELSDDYTLRRQMLLKRLDVTVQSFQWSGKAKMNKDAIAAAFGPKRRQLKEQPEVTISDLLVAREDLSVLEKTSSSNVRKNTQSAVNKVVIGRVPDRGGRPDEQQPPPPEMPSWQKRSDGAGGRGGGRGGGGRGGEQYGGGRGGGGGEHYGGGRGGGGGEHYGGGGGGRGGGRVQGGWAPGGQGGGYQERGGGGRGRGGRGRHSDYNQGGGGGYGGQQYDQQGYQAGNYY